MSRSGRHRSSLPRQRPPKNGKQPGGSKSRQKTAGRQLVRSTVFLTVSLLLLAAVVFFLLADSVRVSEVISAEGHYLSYTDSPAGLILVHDQHLQPKQAADFMIALTEAGISGASFSYDELFDDSDLDSETFYNAIRSRQQQLSNQADLPVDQIWLLLQGRAADLARESYSEIEYAGLILIDAAQPDGLSGSGWSVYPMNRPLIIFVSARQPLLDESVSLFEQLTGEDARLFPGAQPGAGSGRRQYRSADGLTALYLYEELNSSLLAYDYRLVSDLAFELTAFSGPRSEDNDPSEPVLAYAAAGLAAVQNLRYTLLALVGLIAIPFMAGHAARYRISRQSETESDRDLPLIQVSLFSVLRPIIIWIPSLALWVLLLWVGYSLPLSGANLRLAAFFALPGCYGLVSWIAEWIRLQKTGAAHLVIRPVDRAGRWPAAVLMLLSATAYWIWRLIQFGLPQPDIMTAGLAALFVLWHIPGLCLEAELKSLGPAASVMSLRIRLLNWMSGVWPYLLINLFVYIQYGQLAGLIVLIMFMMLGWAAQAGRLLTAVTGRSWAGRLLRALLLASAWLNPVSFNAIFH